MAFAGPTLSVLARRRSTITDVPPPPPPPPPSQPDGWDFTLPSAPLLLGSGIKLYTQQAGNQVVTVTGSDPDNPTVYTGTTFGNLSQHTINLGGLYNGWLIIMPEVPYGATLDLTPTNPSDKTTGGFKFPNLPGVRIVFAGFRIKNGLLWFADTTSDIVFWYCDIESDTDEWVSQWEALGGVDGVFSSTIQNQMANPLPSGFRCTGNGVNRIWFFGCDIHNVGDDGGFTTKATNLFLQGVRIWDVLGQWTHPQWGPSGADLFHSDGLQTTDWNSAGVISFKNSTLGRHWQIGGLNGPSLKTLEIADSWFFHPTSEGTVHGLFINSGVLSGTERKITGSLTGSNRYFDAASMNAAIHEQIKELSGSTTSAQWPQNARLNRPTRISFPGEGTMTVGVPAGVSTAGGVILPSEVFAATGEPAGAWRLAAGTTIQDLFTVVGTAVAGAPWPTP